MYGTDSPIRTLDLSILDGRRFTRRDLVAILTGSPQVTEIKLTAKSWSCTWVRPRCGRGKRLTLLGVQEQVSEVFGRFLKYSQYLYFDHPIVERPRGPVMSWSTRQHIRSDAEGDFRIISTPGGGTIANEIRTRIDTFLGFPLQTTEERVDLYACFPSQATTSKPPLASTKPNSWRPPTPSLPSSTSFRDLPLRSYGAGPSSAPRANSSASRRRPRSTFEGSEGQNEARGAGVMEQGFR